MSKSKVEQLFFLAKEPIINIKKKKSNEHTKKANNRTSMGAGVPPAATDFYKISL